MKQFPSHGPNSAAASPPTTSALYLPVLGLVTTDFVSHQTPTTMSNTTKKKKNPKIKHQLE